jgi:hypothetical protein
MHQKSNNKNAIPLHFNKKAPHARGSFYGQGGILSFDGVKVVRIVTLFCNAGGSKKKPPSGEKPNGGLRRWALQNNSFFTVCGYFCIFWEKMQAKMRFFGVKWGKMG